MKLLKIKLTFVIVSLLLISFSNVLTQTLAPGAPGKDAQWATAGKQAVGTAVSLESKVWFTLAQGVMTEVYYPDVTVANVHLLQFVVVNPKTGKVETEQDDAIHGFKVDSINRTKNVSPVENIIVNKNFQSSSSLAFTQISRSKVKGKSDANLNGLIIGAENSAWTITKNYVTNPENNSVIISVEFRTDDPNNELYIYFDPSLANSGMGDTAWTKGNTLLAKDKNIASALSCRYCKFTEITNGFFGVDDGLTQLKNAGKIEKFYNRAENGNVVQVAKISPVFSNKSDKGIKFEMALGFGKDENSAEKAGTDSLLKGFANVRKQYQEEWINYIKTLRKVEPEYQSQFNMAAMQLKALEDKTVRGANIASLTVPWGGDKNANENTVGGYHLVWSRDLYQVATAFMALGDKAAAERALDFLLKVQQKPDGSFPQNSFLDGKPFWGSLQLDEVAFPLILAYQLGKNDKTIWENHVKKAADFIVKNGPVTPQERWEEEGGYSPSTIAAEIAGLVCAAEIAGKNGDETSANLYLKTADEWQGAVEKWTVTTNGKYSKSPYYVRITQNGKPDAGEKIELNNGAGFFDEREIVDAGFLELVRLGVKTPDDKIIQNSLKVIDEIIRVKTPNGDAFYRYNNDGYGEMDDGRRWNWDGKYTGKGRLWALLSGERGQYELARQQYYLDQVNNRIPNPNRDNTKKYPPAKPGIDYLISAKGRLDSMAKFANEGLMIPEQIWDSPNIPKNADKQFVPELKFGEGTGSATPLAWSMAQFIRLAVNLQEGKNLDTPDVVYNRYVLNKKDAYTGNDSVIIRPTENPENLGEPQVKFGDYKKNGSQDNKNLKKKPAENSDDSGDVDIAEIPVNFKIDKRCFSDKPLYRKDCSYTSVLAKENSQNPQIEKCRLGGFFISCKSSSNEMHACFHYKGEFKTLEIAGDFTDWKPVALKNQKQKDGNRIDCFNFAKTARGEYKLIVDGKWITDPLNPNKVDNGVGGENSVFTMPDYKPTVWDKEIKGFEQILDTVEIKSKVYNETRKIQVFASVIDSTEPYFQPVLYVQDGSDYIKRAAALVIYENLLAAKKIKPFIMVFLDPKDRNKEYWANDDYAKFVAEEVVPAIDAKYDTVKSRDGRAIMGASLGGITSFHAAAKYPEIFGRVGGQSSSFWVDDERVVRELEKLNGKTNFRFYIDDGTLEGVEDSRKVSKLLKDKGFDVTYIEAEAGHNWTAWRDRLADAFIALWK